MRVYDLPDPALCVGLQELIQLGLQLFHGRGPEFERRVPVRLHVLDNGLAFQLLNNLVKEQRPAVIVALDEAPERLDQLQSRGCVTII